MKRKEIILQDENVEPEKRAAAYDKLQNIWYNDALGIALFQPLELFVYRDYVTGYNRNPMFSQTVEFVWNLSK